MKLIKWVKANLIRIKIHLYIGFAADTLIYIGYLLKLSRWIDRNKFQLLTNDFYNANVKHADRMKLYEFVSKKYELKEKQISYLEFGVGFGHSLRWWSEQNASSNTKFWAFDTFEGLPEKYGHLEIGHFSLGGNFPNIDDSRISFEKGLFQDTLLQSVHKIDFSGQTVIHLDADLYTSTLFAFAILYPYLKKGDIIIFDEFVVPREEYRAFEDITKSFYIKLKPIGAINNYLQFAFEIEDIKNHQPKL